MLQEHSLRHTNEERPISCNECDLKFKTESNLSSHKISKHSSRLPYVCKICDNQYPFKYLMERHIRDTHKKEATFKCRICLNLFLDIKGRKRHMLLEHGTDHAYSCECSKTFELMKELRDHKLSVHGEQGKSRKERMDEDDNLIDEKIWTSDDERILN